MKLPLPLILLLIALTSLSACTRGKSKDENVAPAPAQTTQNPAPNTPTAAPAADDWLEGRLPASVTGGTPVDGGEVTLHLEVEPPALNGILADTDMWGQRISLGPIVESLVTLDPYDDPDYRVVPGLAERWEISEDKLVYTFYLRRNVKWHDGQPLTARDVIATWDKIQDKTTKAADARSYFGDDLSKYEAVDDFTVRFTWKKPYFMALDAFTFFPVQPAHVIEKLSGRQYNDAATNPLNRAPIGTGPFKFVEWVNGEKIVLAKHADYWGKKAHLDRITFRIVKDRSVALQLAERGELDTVEKVVSDQWVQMKDNANLRARFHRSRFADANYQWIGWNAKRPFFQDKNVRKALTMLVDRPGMIDKLMYGLYQPTECTFYWRSQECDPEVKPLPVSAAVALTLLDKAGWRDTNRNGVLDKDGVEFRFVFMIPAGSVDAERMGTKMKEDLNRVGIQMDVQTVEWSGFIKRLTKHEFDATTLLWVASARQDPMQIWHSKSRDGGSNYVDFNNPEVDQIITDARVTFDADQRRVLYRRFGAILHAEQPYTLLWVRPRLTLLSKRLKGMRESVEFWQWADWWLDPTATK